MGQIRSMLRGFRRDIGVTLFIVFTLALGIGVSTAMFTVFRAVLLAPTPYADPQRVVAIDTRFTDSGRLPSRVSGGDLIDLAGARDIFDTVARYHGGEVGVQLRGRAEWANVYWVSPDFFDVFKAAAARGRTFKVADEERSIVITPEFANAALGGMDHALGQIVHIDTHAYEVIGVMPEGFGFPGKAQVWAASGVVPENRNRTAYNYKAVGRLKREVSLAAANAGLEALAAQLARAYPENRNKSFAALPVREEMVRNARPTLVLLMAAVLLVLLISCTNAAHLLLARAAARTREFAVRTALGARGMHLVAQMMLESIAIGLAGGVAGIALAYAGIRSVLWFAPENLPRMDEVRADWRVLALGIGIAVLSSLLFGLAPAWQALRSDVQEGLKSASGRGTVGPRSTKLRNALVACEIALSFTLAVGAGLLVRSLIQMNSAPLGFRTDGILVIYAHAPANTMRAMLATSRFFEQALTELDQMPGVQSAAAAMGLPAGRYGSNGKYGLEGFDIHRPDLFQRQPDAGFRLASPAYFSTMGIPLLAGRDFSSRDQYDAPFVAIVSESLVKKSFPDQDPIGRKIICGLDSDKWMTIVGVVGDVRSEGPGQPPGPELYMPFQQHPSMANELQIAVRTAGRPEALADAVERKIRSLNPGIALKSTTLRAMLAESVATPRFRTFLVTVFAVIALLLAMAGVYGVMAYLVAQRTPELGLRMALGSAPWGIVRLVLARAGVLAVGGLAAGTALALGVSRMLESMLFGVRTTGLFGYVVAGAAIAVVTLAAASIPAWRAARIDPAIALRQQ